MIYINPNSIFNSGNEKYFTNQQSKISKNILNILSNADLLTEFLVKQFDEELSISKLQNNKSKSNKINDNDFRYILQKQKENTKLIKFN